MDHPELNHTHLQHFSNRSILPLLKSDPQYKQLKVDGPLPDTNNVQGDIYVLFPKDFENFLFFSISDVTQFKKDLAAYNPTTTHDVLGKLHKISGAKASRGDRVEMYNSQVAFSRLGLDLLGHTEKVRDDHFDQGSMKNEFVSKVLGDSGPWYEPFASQTIHGVFTIAASHDATCKQGTAEITAKFSDSVRITKVEGKARPGANRGHEHFGYLDGVSQPALRGLIKPRKGQLQADAGVLIMGYKGDPYLNQRPAWTKDGTLMVFRKLEQDVVGFDEYLAKAGPLWRQFLPPSQVPKVNPPLSDKEGADLFGARMVGRWKSGAPLANAPFRDNPPLGTDKNKANDFDYTIRGVYGPTDLVCPFTCHTRKTAPRNLDPYLQQQLIETALVVRAGLPYGDEVSPAERTPNGRNATPDRGLLFVCYQSSIEKGFWQQTKAFAGNDFFPPTGLVPQRSGQDPIIGSPEDIPSTQVVQPEFFVTSRGGEYFFVPSVSTLRDWAGGLPQLITSPPTVSGKYRIKTTGQSPNSYWKLTFRSPEDPWISLAPLSNHDRAQEWNIKVLSPGRYNITSVLDGSGLVKSTYGYWGYGFPIRSEGTGTIWSMQAQTIGGDTFTKISLGSGGANYVLDSENEDRTVVHFYSKKNDALNQRWVFEPVQ